MTTLARKEAQELGGVSAICLLAVVADACSLHWRPTPIDAFPEVLIAAIAPAVLAAGRFANEASGGTLPFLLSLPVTRLRLWATKAALGWLATLCVAGVLAAAVALHEGGSRDPEPGSAASVVCLVWIGVCAVSLSYAAGLLCSTLLENVALAAAAGVSLAIAGNVAVVLLLVWRTPSGEPSMALVAGGYLALTGLFAAGSAALFSLRETLYRRRSRSAS